MPTASALNLIIDITNPTKSGILQSFQNRLPATIPELIRNDVETVSLRFVQPSAGTSRPWDDVNYSTAQTILGLGDFDAIPTSGTNTFQFGPRTTGSTNSNTTVNITGATTGIVSGMFVSGAGIVQGTTATISGSTVTLSIAATATATGVPLYFYNETAAIATGATALTVSTAVNALASVAAIGTVVVTLPEPGVYLFVLPAGVTAGYFSGNPAGLNPASSVVVSEVVVGAAGVSSQQLWECFVNAYALNSTWTTFPAAAAAVTSLATGASFSPTGTTVSGTNTITVISSTTGLVVGMSVSGTGIPANTVLLALSGSTGTISNNSTASGSGVTFTFATPSIQQISITAGAYDGSIALTTPLITTQAIPVPLSGTSATAIQSALNSLGAAYSVAGNVGGPWVVTDPTGNNTAIAVNISGLVIPVGLTGSLTLSTYAMLQKFISSGLTTVTLELECQVTPVGGGQSTPLQLAVNVNKNVINLAALVPAPSIAFLTQAQIQALISALRATGYLSVSSTASSTLSIPANCMIFTETVTAGVGSGAYTYNLTLSSASRQIGDKFYLALSIPASTNPTFQIKNNAGSVIYTAIGTGIAGPVLRSFTFGSDWTLDA